MTSLDHHIFTLPDRALIEISGEDRIAFLQGLVTQDMDKLSAETPILYSCLLTPQGKFQSDFFIIYQNDKIIVECRASHCESLSKKLMLHKLRSKVSIQPVVNAQVFVSFSPDTEGYKDPRHQDLGYRVYGQNHDTDTEMRDLSLYTELCFNLGIPDAEKALTEGQSTLFEGNLDQLGAVSFSKGCYMGQELVSRIHHRGLVKRRLFTLRSENEMSVGMDVHSKDGKTIGEIRDTFGNTAHAILKIDEADNIADDYEILTRPDASLL